ncbi:hypothetical protein Tco_0821427 [Tanacetum coccineum]|uniref:Uncharacterized protein n=1 Tax=Tanacetum coccineum TaxID=301880 RepID=A0ABQ5AGI8_9ASTR
MRKMAMMKKIDGLNNEKGTDISKITRKLSKTGKHGHKKRKSTIEAKDAKPKPEKVNLQSNWSNLGQQKSTTKGQNPKYSTLVLQVSEKSTNSP